MARFRFRLERVLSIRKREEEREKMAFGSAEKARAEAERRVIEFRNEITRMKDEAGRRLSGRFTVDELRSAHEYLLRLSFDEEEARVLLAEREAEKEVARLRLIEAMKKRQLLENLRERRREEWRYEELRAEQGDLDEIGQTIWRRRREEAPSGY